MSALHPAMKKLFATVLFIAIILLAVSFVLMVLNITFFYGFVPVTIHTTGNHANPFGLTVPLIWIIHLTVGFVAGMAFNKKRFLLAGSMGLLCAALITGISFLYFGWRESISTVEVLFPLTGGIVPVLLLNDYLNRKFPGKDAQPARNTPENG